MSLFRGDKPLSAEERFEYEFECEMQRRREAGLVMEGLDRSGESVWASTLRGSRELRQCIQVRLVDPNHVRDA